VKLTARWCLVALVPVLLLACPEAKPPPPPVAVQPTPPVAPTPTPEAPPPEEPPAPPPRPAVTLNEPAAADGGTLPEEAMPPWARVEVGDYVVYDLETSRSEAADVFRIGGGTRTPPVSARVKLTAMVVDKTGVVVDVRYVPHGVNTTVPRWLESGMSFHVALGTARPKGPTTEPGVLWLPPKTPFKSVEHAGKTYKCRFHREEAASADGTPTRRCVGSPDRALILSSGLVYAQGIKGADGNPLTAILVEAGRAAADGKPGYDAFQDGAALVTRQTSPAGERLSLLKVERVG
jgi:hypothetical protein